MTTKMAMLRKSGCADAVGKTVNSVDAGAAVGDVAGVDAGGDVTGVDAGCEGDTDVRASRVVAVQSLTRKGGREFSGSI